MFLAQRANQVQKNQQTSIFAKKFTKLDNTKISLFVKKGMQHPTNFGFWGSIKDILRQSYYICLYLFLQRELSINYSKPT